MIHIGINHRFKMHFVVVNVWIGPCKCFNFFRCILLKIWFVFRECNTRLIASTLVIWNFRAEPFIFNLLINQGLVRLIDNTNRSFGGCKY